MATDSKKRKLPDDDNIDLESSNPKSSKRRRLNENIDDNDEHKENMLKLPDLPLSIIFLTGNKGKLHEVQNYVGDEIKKYIINYKIDLDEIQGNEKEILMNKLNNAKKVILGELQSNNNNNNNKNNKNKKDIYILVEDTSLSLGQYSKNEVNFPGPFCKFLLKSNGCQGYIDMIKNHTDKSCIALCLFALLKIDDDDINENNKPLFFKGECKGNITDKARGDNGFGWDPIFEFIGNNKTFAEMSTDEKNKISHRANALKQLKQYLENDLMPKITDNK